MNIQALIFIFVSILGSLSMAEPQTLKLNGDYVKIVKIADGGPADDMGAISRNIEVTIQTIEDGSLAKFSFAVDDINMRHFYGELQNADLALPMGETIELTYDPKVTNSLKLKSHGAATGKRSLTLKASKVRVIKYETMGSMDGLGGYARQSRVTLKFLGDGSLGYLFFGIDQINYQLFSRSIGNIGSALKMGNDVEIKYDPHGYNSLEFAIKAPDSIARICRRIFVY